ncbi:DUF2007 domain-containing protein [Salmonella enterica]
MTTRRSVMYQSERFYRSACMGLSPVSGKAGHPTPGANVWTEKPCRRALTMWNIHPERGEFRLLEQFLSPLDARIVAGRLVSEGIEVMLLDEHMVWNNLLQSQAVGGVKLLVKQHDLDAALRVMEDIRSGHWCPDKVNQDEAVRESCAACLRWAKWLLSAVMIIFLFILPVIALFRRVFE